jgi:hypothetical protein
MELPGDGRGLCDDRTESVVKRGGTEWLLLYGIGRNQKKNKNLRAMHQGEEKITPTYKLVLRSIRHNTITDAATGSLLLVSGRLRQPTFQRTLFSLLKSSGEETVVVKRGAASVLMMEKTCQI